MILILYYFTINCAILLFQSFTSHVARKVIYEKIQKLNILKLNLHKFLMLVWEPSKNFILDYTKAINDGIQLTWL